MAALAGLLVACSADPAPPPAAAPPPLPSPVEQPANPTPPAIPMPPPPTRILSEADAKRLLASA